MSRPDSTPPTPDSTRAYWYPRIRGALTVIGGTLGYVALATAFGDDASFGTAFVGMLGSTAAMGWVWWLEARRAAREDAAQRSAAQRSAAQQPAAQQPAAQQPAAQRDAGTT